MPQMTFKGFTYELDPRPFGCDWESCNKDFKRRSDLTRHYKIHTNDRPHPCTAPGCEKRFIQRSALVVHTRTHTGEKPHKCRYPGCLKRFSDSSSLARHRHVHTGNRHRRCAHIDCPKSFCRKKILVKQEQQPQRRGVFNMSRGDYVSDSESSQSPFTPAQPATPQPLQDITAHEASILQGGIFQCASMIGSDEHVYNCYMEESFHSPDSVSEELNDGHILHRLNGMPQQQFLYDIANSNADIETLTMSNQYHDSSEQVHHSTVDISYSHSGLSNTPHSSPASFSSISTHGHIIVENRYKPQGLQNTICSPHNASLIGKPAQIMEYSQQSVQGRPQMVIQQRQIPAHGGERYRAPMLVKSEPWYGWM